MNPLTQFNSFWLDHNGAEVKLNGHVHILRVSSYTAIYPYRHQVISVHAEPKNKSAKYYLDVKHVLHDDWSTDVLASGLDIEAEIRQQLVK